MQKSTSVYFGPEKGEAVENWISAYGPNGESWLKHLGLKPDGKPLGDGRYIYEYDGEGRRCEVLSFNDSTNDNVPNHIRRFAYSDEMNMGELGVECREYGARRQERCTLEEKPITTQKAWILLPKILLKLNLRWG